MKFLSKIGCLLSLFCVSVCVTFYSSAYVHVSLRANFIFLRLSLHVPVSVIVFLLSAFCFCVLYLFVLPFCVTPLRFPFLYRSCRRHEITLVSMMQDPRAEKRLLA